MADNNRKINKPKSRGKRICPSHAKWKGRVKPRLSTSASTPDTTSNSPTRTQKWCLPQKTEKYNREIKIGMMEGDKVPSAGDYVLGVASFDTGSEYNLINRGFLQQNRLAWAPSPNDTLILQMNGDEIECLGEVVGRWNPTKTENGDGFRPRFETSTFKIVDLPECDIIIGRRTINKLGLFQLNRSFFGAFRQLPHRVDAALARRRQEEAERKRRKEQEEMEKYEDEQAQKRKAADPQAP